MLTVGVMQIRSEKGLVHTKPRGIFIMTEVILQFSGNPSHGVIRKEPKEGTAFCGYTACCILD